MKTKYQVTFFTFFLLALFSCQTEEEMTPPNIIFIMTDDHSAQALSAYGSRINETPNLDRIAQNGIRFDRAYCTNSICAPSRAVILTGKYSHKNGVLNNSQTFDGTQQTLPKLMKEGGYETAMIGKWHLKSHPTGFDYWNVLPGQGDYYNPKFIEMGEHKTHEGYVTDLTTDFALDWLTDRTGEKPFFLMLQHKAPHRNWMPSPKHLTLYDDRDIPEPETLFDDYETRTVASKDQEMSISDHLHLSYDLKVKNAPPRGADWMNHWLDNKLESMTDKQRTDFLDAYEPKNEVFLEANLEGKELVRWKYQRYIKDYLRCIASVDENIGRVLDYLEGEGLSENTLIIYTSDQGFYLGEHGWFDKRFMYEESYRMPLMVQYPKKIKAGASTDALVMNVDFASTMLDFAGLSTPEDMQGESFRSIAETAQESENWREATYYHYFEFPGVHAVKRHYGVRTKRYKLMHFYHDIDAWEMYDLKADPKELNNVYGKAEYADVQKDLEVKLVEAQKKYDDLPEDFMPNLSRKKAEHKALEATYNFIQMPDPKYDNNFETQMSDGMKWTFNPYVSSPLDTWLGFNENDCEVVLDLGKPTDFEQIGLNCYQNSDSWIYYPTAIEFSISDNGKDFELVEKMEIENEGYKGGIQLFQTSKKAQKTRFVKVKTSKMALIPNGRPGAGKKSWVFVDEVMVN
ncbi:sulfatase-like hydrolase/transferase [Saprospiraceae bacterium]|nr:sulfatase-like hydrolase/transferase [Saprospiraceae bacterium]